MHCSDVLALYYAGFAAKLARKPLVCHVRCRFEQLPRGQRALLRLTDHFVFVARESWKAFAIDVPESRMSVIHDGVESPPPCQPADRASVFAEFSWGPEIRVVGMIARVAPAKDFETLIAAAEKVVRREPLVRFLVVGDNSSTPEYRQHWTMLRRLLVERKLESVFVFTGHRGDVLRLMCAMDLVTLVTHSEGLPLVVLEALSLAKPVLATAVGGIPEVIDSGKTGLLHASGEADCLAQQILDLLRDPQRAAALGSAGASLIRERFQPSVFARNMRDLYARLARRQAMRAASP